MTKLFGVPMDQLMLVLMAVFGACVLLCVLSALRHPVAFRLAVRNLPRRRTQSILIVVGLMLATLLFSASFATGDTLTESVRRQALASIGEVDLILEGEPGEGGVSPYFDANVTGQVEEALASAPEAEGVAPSIRLSVPVLVERTGLSEPRLDILGLPPALGSGFAPPRDAEGQILALEDLDPGEVFVSAAAARRLELEIGDQVLAFLRAEPSELRVKGIYQEGGHPAGPRALLLPLASLQDLAGRKGQINSVLVTSRGDDAEAAASAKSLAASLAGLAEGLGLEASPVKQEAMDQADEAGASFSTIFLLFAQFSIAAGVLLIFLILVMLAAERKHELGIARAVGAQRAHIIRIFAYEGALYAVSAGAVGSLLGLVVGWIMVRVLGVAFGQMGGGEELKLVFAFNPRSLVIAYTLGVVLTFAVVLASSWRVSRLNIVRAVRDIPEPQLAKRGWKRLILTALLPVAGAALTVVGLEGEQMGPYSLGSSLVIMGLPLLARRFGLPDRPAYTVAGLGLVVWWLLPASVTEGWTADMQQGMEMFFISGIMLVIGGVWVVMFNSSVFLTIFSPLAGRFRSLAPVLRTAVAYPMQARFRTGMTLAMFSLIVFTLVVMAFIISGIQSMYENEEVFTGGFHVRADASYTNPVGDLRGEIGKGGGLDPADVEAVGGIAYGWLEARGAGGAEDFAELTVEAVDKAYAEATTYGFRLRAPGYDSDAEVWRALQERPNTAVVSAALVPTKANYNMGAPPPDIRLEGFWLQDESLPAGVELFVRSRAGAQEQRLEVIGVLDPMAVYAGLAVVSQASLKGLTSENVVPRSWFLRLRDGEGAESAAKALEKQFMANGLQAESLAAEIESFSAINIMINRLMEGFMALGLVVGIAALGVIAARSVVERRQQIGVMRAMGFQKRMVLASFLLESSFVALLGIGLGLVLGLALSPQIINTMSRDFEGMQMVLPWGQLILVFVIACAASLLTTVLPARQAARVYPAEALRYE